MKKSLKNLIKFEMTTTKPLHKKTLNKVWTFLKNYVKKLKIFVEILQNFYEIF